MAATIRVLQVYEYVRRRLREGVCPTMREISDALELRSSSAAQRCVNELIAGGYLESVPGKKRSLRLAAKPAPVAARPDAPCVVYPLYAPRFMGMERLSADVSDLEASCGCETAQDCSCVGYDVCCVPSYSPQRNLYCVCPDD